MSKFMNALRFYTASPRAARRRHRSCTNLYEELSVYAVECPQFVSCSWFMRMLQLQVEAPGGSGSLTHVSVHSTQFY
jgi:hypothetical protein